MRSHARIGSHPLHPILVSFPIALWTAALVSDLAGVYFDHSLLWSAGFYATLGGILGAVLAAGAGVIDLFKTIPPKSSARRRGITHGLLNSGVLIVFSYLAIHRGNAYTQPDGIVLALESLAVMVMGFSGWMGGTLVYRNQIGVDHRTANAGKSIERELSGWDKPVCKQGELSEGQSMLVKIAGQRIVVARCSEGLVAFSDRCPHKGGPLSDGVVAGCIVQCPWHGSQFDILTGRVVTGPAKQNIKSYEVEIVDKEVFVKPPKAPSRKAA